MNLINKLPKKYHKYIKSVEAESGLIDNCKYILTLSDGYTFDDGGQTYPVRSLKEALEFIKIIERRH